MNRSLLWVVLVVAVFGTPGLATAQDILIFDSQIDGDIPDAARDRFRASIHAGAEEATELDVATEAATRAALGGAAACREATCAAAAGRQSGARAAIFATIYGEAEIYDFEVKIYSLEDGAVLAEQIGECTFCPEGEALDALRFATQAAVSGARIPERGEDGQDDDGTDTSEAAVTAVDGVEAGDIRVGISTIPDDAVIVVNGERAGTGRASLDVAPQRLEIVVRADGYETYTESVNVREGMTGPIFLRAHLARTVADPGPPSSARAPTPIPSPQPEGFNRRAAGGVLIGVGTAMAVAGVVVLSLDGKSACADGSLSDCPDIYETTGGGSALTAIGAIAAGAGLGLIISSAGDASADSPAAAVGVGDVGGRAGVWLRGRF